MDKVLNSNINASKFPTNFRRIRFSSIALLALKTAAHLHNSPCNSETTSSYHSFSSYCFSPHWQCCILAKHLADTETFQGDLWHQQFLSLNTHTNTGLFPRLWNVSSRVTAGPWTLSPNVWDVLLMAVGQVTVAFTPLPNHFHALKDHGERELCGRCSVLLALTCLAPKTWCMQHRRKKSMKLCCTLQSFTTSVDGTVKSTAGSITETQTPAVITWG